MEGTEATGVLKIKSPLKTSMEELKQTLCSTGVGICAPSKEQLLYLIVEKKDSSGNPIQYIIVKFKKESIEILFSILEKENPLERKFKVIKTIVPIITAISHHYGFDEKATFSLIEDFLEDIKDIVKGDARKLYMLNSKLKMEISKLQEKIENCEKEKEKLISELYEKTREAGKLQTKLKKYETISDNVLKEKIIEWLKDNNGEIDIVKFSKLYGVPESRVETALDELTKEGYIEPQR